MGMETRTGKPSPPRSGCVKAKSGKTASNENCNALITIYQCAPYSQRSANKPVIGKADGDIRTAIEDQDVLEGFVP
jgi:hypothetical protein